MNPVVVLASGGAALLLSAGLRLPSLSSSLLAAYVAFVANAGLLTWGLSPLRSVTEWRLLAAELVVLGLAAAWWWRRGRPGLPLARARHVLRELVHDPATAAFLALVVALLGYELLVGLGGQPNNWDSLTYHLARTATWVKHGGIVHTMYTNGNMLATMEDILGIDHLGMNDANAQPMDDAFTTTPNLQPYDVIIPGVLCRPPVHPDLVPQCRDARARKTEFVPSLRSPQWWISHTHRWAWNAPDLNDAQAFNRLVWEGTKGANVPYSTERSGDDLSFDRTRVLAAERSP